MNIPRIGAAVTVAAAAVLALSGCFQLPNLGGQQTPQTPTTPSDPTTSEPTNTTPADPAADLTAQLVGTHWSGNAGNAATDIGIDVAFTLEADGTMLIDTWNDATDVPYDDPSDTWSVSGDQITVHLSNIQNISYIELTGTATATGPISLTGVDGNGDTGYSMTMTLG